MHENEIGTVIVDTAVKLHIKLGPGLLEKVYETILAKQLQKQGLQVDRQVPIPIEFEGEKFEEGFIANLIINKKVIIELKSVEQIKQSSQKATFNLPSSNRSKSRLPLKLWRSPHERRHPQNHQRHPRLNPPCLRGSV